MPDPGDTAILDAPGSTAYTVSLTANATVASIQTRSNALLDVKASFNVTAGTGSGANAGAIRIENGGTLTLQGTVENTGSIEIFGDVATTTIVLGSGGVALIGGGAVFLNFTGGKFQQIIPAAGRLGAYPIATHKRARPDRRFWTHDRDRGRRRLS